MPNTTPCLDTPELVHLIADIARRTAHARVFSVAAATQGRKGERPAELSLLHKAGAVGFTDDGDAIASAQMQLRVFETIRSFGGVFMQHCRNQHSPSALPCTRAKSQQGSASQAGRQSQKNSSSARHLTPPLARTGLATLRKPLRYHVQHLSSAGSAELVRRARG